MNSVKIFRSLGDLGLTSGASIKDVVGAVIAKGSPSIYLGQYASGDAITGLPDTYVVIRIFNVGRTMIEVDKGAKKYIKVIGGMSSWDSTAWYLFTGTVITS